MIIISENQNNRIIDISLYEFMETCYKCGYRFIVCNISDEEFTNIQRQINNNIILDDQIFIKDSFRLIAGYDNKQSYIEFIEPDKQGSFLLIDKNFYYDPRKTPFIQENYIGHYVNGLKIYTTENTQNIIKHYNNIEKNYTLNLSTIRNLSEVLKTSFEDFIQMEDKAQQKVLNKIKKTS